jgi:hypothetical protein
MRVSFTLRPFYPRENSAGSLGGWRETLSGLNTVANRKHLRLPQNESRFSGSPYHCSVTILKAVFLITEWVEELM